MKIIEMYVNAVTHYLNEDIREDVRKELHTNIEDMLPENPSEEDIKKILERLGDPRKLAREYSQTKRYLIGPDLYDDYISVLKLVTGIITIVLVFAGLVNQLISEPAEMDIIKMLTSVISSAIVSTFQGIMQGFIWITLIFAILERTGVQEGNVPFIKKKWTIEDLVKCETESKNKISRGETIAAMFFVAIFTVILCIKPGIFGLYIKGNDGLTMVAPVFARENLQFYNPFIIILAILGLCIIIWKYIAGRWNISLAIANTLDNAAICVLVFVMAYDSTLYNVKFISAFAGLAKTSISHMTASWYSGIKVFAIVFTIICCWDSINGFIKCRK